MNNALRRRRKKPHHPKRPIANRTATASPQRIPHECVCEAETSGLKSAQRDKRHRCLCLPTTFMLMPAIQAAASPPPPRRSRCLLSDRLIEMPANAAELANLPLAQLSRQSFRHLPRFRTEQCRRHVATFAWKSGNEEKCHVMSRHLPRHFEPRAQTASVGLILKKVSAAEAEKSVRS